MASEGAVHVSPRISCCRHAVRRRRFMDHSLWVTIWFASVILSFFPWTGFLKQKAVSGFVRNCWNRFVPWYKARRSDFGIVFFPKWGLVIVFITWFHQRNQNIYWATFIHQRMIEKKNKQKQYTINTKIHSICKIIKRSMYVAYKINCK